MFLLSGCTEEKQQPEEQKPAPIQAEQVGREAAAAIKTTLNKAETASGLQSEHNKALEDQAQSQ
jgi:hypothetical protein